MADYEKAHKSMIPVVSNALQSGAGATSMIMQGLAANQLRTQTIAPFDGVISRLYIVLDAAPGGVETQTVTVLVNGAPTAITFVITGAATTGNDLVNQVAVAAGDTIVCRFVASVACANARVTGGLGYTT